MKKSQVSVFIIFSIMIVGILMVLLFIKSRDNTYEEKIMPEVAPVHGFVQDCIKKIAEESVYNIGQTGGYFIKANLSTDNNVAYYFYNQEDFMPEKESLEKELSQYMSTMLFFCVRGFTDFPDFSIKQKEIKSKAVIYDEKVTFEIIYPLVITKDEKSFSFKNFKDIEVETRLGTVHNVIRRFIDEQMKNKEDICLTCLSDYADEKDLYVSMYEYKDRTIMFSIIDKKIKLMGEDYAYYFANKY
ncbi:MAG: hypothetical protein Q8N99_07975 [Nanoarchaeota archaeon]|nr:hypothetical protein [Nanoarchaeota archaeon]